MIISIKDYFKQWLSFLYLIPSTISVLQTFFNEEIKGTGLNFINSLTKIQIIYIFILISIITGVNITFIKNKLIVQLKSDLEIIRQQNNSRVPTTINNTFYGNIDQRQFVDSTVIIGDKSKIIDK
mgnify:CR=1 FL=1|jgi:hypothetical protein